MTKGIGHVSSVDGLLSPVGETCQKRGLDCGKTVGGRNVKPNVLLFQHFSLKAEARAQRSGGFSVPPVTVSSVVRTLPPAASSSCEVRVLSCAQFSYGLPFLRTAREMTTKIRYCHRVCVLHCRKVKQGYDCSLHLRV